MTTLRETIDEYRAAEAAFAPYRKALSERIMDAINTFKRVGREHGLYGSAWEYGWATHIDWINFSDLDIGDEVIYIEYDRGEVGVGDATISFDEIERAEIYATDAAAAARAARTAEVERFKAARRRDLERQLAELG